MPSVPQHQPSRIDNATNISNLQSNNDQMPDFNSMFSGPNNPMVNANTPNTYQGEILAANDDMNRPLNAY